MILKRVVEHNRQQHWTAVIIKLAMKFYATVQRQSQWGAFRAFCQSEYFKRSAGILTGRQLMLQPSESGTIPSADVEDAMAAYRRMLDRPDFIEWLPTTLNGPAKPWPAKATCKRH